MASTASYPIIVPKAGDLLVGTQTYTDADPVLDNPTRNFTVASVASLANSINLSYTAYAALLTQTGNAAPVATVLQNNTGATIAWTRTGGGAYTATANSNIFTANKTAVIINQGSGVSSNNIKWTNPTTSTVTIDTTADSVLTVGFIEIRVYA
jgi:hypothetical protein